MKKLIILIMFLFTFLNANANWELIKEGPINTIALENNLLYVGTENGLFISSDNGDNWELDSYFDGIWISLIKYYEDVFYIIGYKKLETAEYQAYIFISNDFGNSWSAKKMQFGVTDFIVVNSEIIVAGDRIYKSTDIGNSWEEVGPGRVSTLGYNEGVIYAGTYGDMQTSSRMYISTDMGLTWEYKNEGLNDHDSERSYYNFYSKGDSVFAGGDFSTLYVTTNSDERWWKVSGIYSYYFKIWNEILFSSAGFLGGMHISYDYGITRITTIFDTTITWMYDKGQAKLIEIDENTNSIFALEFVWSSSIPNRLYRASLDQIVSVQDQLIKTDEYEINLYPNPADNMLNFTFTSENTYEASVIIYDILGKKVLELAQGQYGYSSNSQSIDISELPNGTYTFSINVNGNLHSKIFIVIRD